MLASVRAVSLLVACGCLFFHLAELGGEMTKSLVPQSWRRRKGVARFLLEVPPTLTLWGLMGGIALALLDNPLAIGLFALSGLVSSLTPWPKEVEKRITNAMGGIMAFAGVAYAAIYAATGFFLPL